MILVTRINVFMLRTDGVVDEPLGQ